MTKAYGRAPASSEFAWWKLTPKQKAVLQQKRLSGDYGGETAASIGYAPYFWSQEYGNPAANITAQHFAEEAWNRFRRRAKDVLRSLSE